MLWNGGSIGESIASGRHSAAAPLAALLREPFARLGSTSPDLDASLAAHAVVGKISDYLWQRTTPTPADLAQITTFCLRAATPT